MVLGYNVVKPGAGLCCGIYGLCALRFRAAGSTPVAERFRLPPVSFSSPRQSFGRGQSVFPPRGKFYSYTEAMNGKL